MDEKKFNVDEALKELEEINRKLGNSNIDLAESIELYEKGVKLASECKTHLEGTEKTLQVLRAQA